MDVRSHYAVADAFAEAWRLKLPLVAIHVATLVLFAAILTPLAGLALSGALLLSGEPALTDKDIAHFFLSPAGAVVMTALAALYLALQVVGIAAKMSVLSAEHAQRSAGTLAALRLVVAQGPRLVRFALGLVLRVAVFVLPALAIAGACALLLLGEYDINFYLSARPPEFLAAVGIGAVTLAVLAVLLVPRLLGWTLALPLVLFEDAAPGTSFKDSAHAMQGRRMQLFRRIVLWALAALALSLIVGALTAAAARGALALSGSEIDRLAALLLGVLALYVVASSLVAALTSGALAHILLDEAGWPEPFHRATQRPRVGLWSTVAVGLVVVAALSGLAAPRIAPPEEIAVIAHRGGAADRPENTLAAMELGIEQGADWLEIDVQENADGEVIVVHDSDFMKTAGVATKVWDVTAEELATIDIGSWFSPDYADARVPLLSDVLEAARDKSKVLIELKYYGHDIALSEKVAEIVDALGMADQVAAMSLDPRQAARMKDTRPDWSVGLLAATSLGRLDRREADFLAVSTALASPGLLRRMEEAGRPVYVWTVNDAPAMARYATMGVSGLITDRPALARTVLEDLATLSPAERLALVLSDRLGLDMSTPASAPDGS